MININIEDKETENKYKNKLKELYKRFPKLKKHKVITNPYHLLEIHYYLNFCSDNKLYDYINEEAKKLQKIDIISDEE